MVLHAGLHRNHRYRAPVRTVLTLGARATRDADVYVTCNPTPAGILTLNTFLCPLAVVVHWLSKKSPCLCENI
jgi:hypothetical protein